MGGTVGASLRTLAGDWLRRALRGVEVGAGFEAADPYNVDRRIVWSLARLILNH